jgi:hypothetical protein
VDHGYLYYIPRVIEITETTGFADAKILGVLGNRRIGPMGQNRVLELVSEDR